MSSSYYVLDKMMPWKRQVPEDDTAEEVVGSTTCGPIKGLKNRHGIIEFRVSPALEVSRRRPQKVTEA